VLTVSGVNILPFTATEYLVNSSKAEAAISIRNDYVWMDMPQTGNQDDNWSCGPTSAARVINFYGHNVNRVSLVNAINKDFVIPPSFNVPAPTLTNPLRKRRVDIRTGTTPHALRDVMKRWEGDKVKLERKAEFNKLLGLLRQGKPVIVLLRVEPSINVVGTTWPAMHWVVVNGFSDKHIYFTETNDGKIYQYSYGDFQSKWDWRVGKG
ncbi:MAG: C39 family peptidase, partial [Dolichospermum sp.]